MAAQTEISGGKGVGTSKGNGLVDPSKASANSSSTGVTTTTLTTVAGISQQRQNSNAGTTSRSSTTAVESGEGVTGGFGADESRSGPYVDLATSKNVTALLGKTAYLNCRVKNLGNKTVSAFRECDGSP